MNEILKKIDEESDLYRAVPRNSSSFCQGEYKGYVDGLQKAKEIILFQQKEFTIGDKIRESNESLVEWYANRVNLYVCGESVTVNPLNKEKCLNYLNQPYTNTIN